MDYAALAAQFGGKSQPDYAALAQQFGGTSAAAAAPAADAKPVDDPTDGMSTTQKVLAGIGQGMTKAARAVASGVRLLGPQYAASADAVGLPNEADAQEAARLDAPLMKTTAGKVGSGIGTGAVGLPMMLVPGANTYLGASVLGGAFGGATSDGGLMDRGQNALYGAAGGAAGKAVGDVLGAGVNALASNRAGTQATAQAANAGRDSAAAAAQKAGYVLPPTEVNPTVMSQVLEGTSGKIKTSQTASAKNQPVTNALAKTELGLPADQPITIPDLAAIRRQAGNAYDAVAGSGTITPTPAYGQALDAITAPARQAAQGFPNAAPNPLIGAIDALKSPQFDAASAISQIKSLRMQADKAYAGGDKDMGAGLKAGANAIEDAIDQHLSTTGAPADVLQNFRDARQLIAKTYSVQKALNPTTGNVSAPVLASQLAKGKPLSGGLLTAAQAAQAFPKATQALAQNPNALSPLDFFTGLMAATMSGHPYLGAAPLLRPAIRSGILSKPFQNALAPGYGTNPVLDALGSNGLQRLLPAIGASVPTNK